MKQYGTAPGQNNYTPDFLQHFDQKDGGKIIILKSLLKTSDLTLLFSGRAASQAGEGSPPQSASVQQQQLQQQQQQQVREQLQRNG